MTLPTPGDWWVQPEWSPDGKHLLTAIANISDPGQSGVWRVWQTKEELIEYAKECCVFRELSEGGAQAVRVAVRSVSSGVKFLCHPQSAGSKLCYVTRDT